MGKIYIDNPDNITAADLDSFDIKEALEELQTSSEFDGDEIILDGSSFATEVKIKREGNKFRRTISVDKTEMEQVLRDCQTRRHIETLNGNGFTSGYFGGGMSYDVPDDIVSGIKLEYGVDLANPEDKYAFNKIIEEDFPGFKCTNRKLRMSPPRTLGKKPRK